MTESKKVLRQHDLKRKQKNRAKRQREGLRRWGFSATIFHGDGTQAGKHMPGLSYGSYEQAVAVGDRLKAIFLENNELAADDIVKVEPTPYEKISPDTMRQFEGLNDQAALVGKALFIMAEKYKEFISACNEPIDDCSKSIGQLVNDALDKAREILFPRLGQATLKLSQVEGAVVAMAQEPVPPNEIEPDEVSTSRPNVTELVDGPH